MINIYNEDCIKGSRKIEDNSVDLIICDPPFGIGESKFEKHYNRKNKVFDGYEEAPQDYEKFSNEWIKEAKRILKQNGTFYIISGWTNLLEILSAIKNNGLITLNHIIWKFNFGVNTTKKFVSSHYHILRVAKNERGLTFNTFCRFGPQEKSEKNGSLLYEDLEDVFVVNKEFNQGEEKNQNKLPSSLINKLILYSSKEEDTICDFFMGNFTTAYSAIGFNRHCLGFEINTTSFDYHMQKIKKIKPGCLIETQKKVKVEIPKNKGKPITQKEIEEVKKRFKKLRGQKTKSQIVDILGAEYGRGKFSIINILKR